MGEIVRIGKIKTNERYKRAKGFNRVLMVYTKGVFFIYEPKIGSIDINIPNFH